MNLIVYSGKECPSCDQLCMSLDKFKIPYTKKYVEEHNEDVSNFGIMSVPFTMLKVNDNPHTTWTGYHGMKMIHEIIQTMREVV